MGISPETPSNYAESFKEESAELHRKAIEKGSELQKKAAGKRLEAKEVDLTAEFKEETEKAAKLEALRKTAEEAADKKPN